MMHCRRKSASDSAQRWHCASFPKSFGTPQIRFLSKTWKGTLSISMSKHITELKRVEEALRESYQFLQSTLDALSASIVILEESGTIVAVNAAWRRFVPAHDLSASAHGVGTDYLEFCHAVSGQVGTSVQEFLAGLQAVMARQCPT